MAEEELKPKPVPAPVEVTNEAPMPVAVVTEYDSDPQARSNARKIAVEARVEADKLRTEDSRKISGIWEGTQRQVALLVVITAQVVVGTIVLAPVIIAVLGRDVPNFVVTASVAGMLFLTGVANLVIGFYFGRTNHQRVGGDVSHREDSYGR